MSSRKHLALLLAASAALAAAARPAFGAATIVIQNNDPPGVGFNDPTGVDPVGGNPGTTLGAQRLNAFQAAASKWGATLTSTVTIVIRAQWISQTCSASGAVLGSARALTAHANFGGAPVSDHYYGAALANKLSGSDLNGATAEIEANFNINLGQPGCPFTFYLGLDNNHGIDNIDLVTVLTHEFGHGLGFQTFTFGLTGDQLGDPPDEYPSVWDDFMLDTTTGKTWTEMTDGERVASAINTGNLVWTGPNAVAAVPNVLGGTPRLVVTAPASVAGTYQVGQASFGPALNSPGVTGEVMPLDDTAASQACTALNTLNAAAVAGKIALVDRGTCAFTVKVKNAQNAGAIAVLIADNVPGSPPAGITGADPTITIPAVRITQADGATLRAALKTRSRLHSGMSANLGLNLAIRAGADASNRPLLYTPNPYQQGSSVSHWDTTAFPNQLMEPVINGDLTHEVTPPNDLTFPLLKDIGWN